jgi:hypothetical protein
MAYNRAIDKISRLKRIILISDIVPRHDRSGGEVVLWRHVSLLTATGDILLEVPTSSLVLWKSRAWVSFLIHCLKRMRLSRLVRVLEPALEGWRVIPIHISHEEVRKTYAAILTVAHGLEWTRALALARSTQLPLITIFHDWYPDASGSSRGFCQVWDWKFRQLYQGSALAFCVSEGMQRELGPHRNAHVLPPLPDPGIRQLSSIEKAQVTSEPNKPVHLYYSGFAGGLYRPLLQQLISAVNADERFTLHLSGSETNQLTVEEDNPRLRISGFLDGPAWENAFNEADFLLVVLSFKPRERRHLRTHFPSKLVEYANRGRPIVIWGPAGSSAVEWGRHQAGVKICEDSSASTLLDVVARASKEHLNAIVDPSFDPAVIQYKFESEIMKLLNSVSTQP